MFLFFFRWKAMLCWHNTKNSILFFHKLCLGLAEEQIKVYLDEFEQRVEQEILMIGNISLDDVQVRM